MLPALLFVSSKPETIVSLEQAVDAETSRILNNHRILLLFSYHPVLCSLVSLLEDGTQHDLLETAPGSAEDLEAQQSVFRSDRKQHCLDPRGNITGQVPLLDRTAI